MATEEPDFKVLKKDKNIEYREYPGYLRAAVEVESSTHNEAGSQAFSTLANYIFGNNKEKSKLRMTAPVAIKPADTGSYEVSFIMPSEYSMETIPEPVNPQIKLHEVAEHRAVAIIFSGHSDENKVNEKTKLLNNWIAENKLVAIGFPVLARYDPPWKPGFMRRNEVLIKVE
jgi:effector-binding domain-containing protein